MKETLPHDAPGATGPARIPGLAVASLVLGILGLVGSVILIGAPLALVGLALGAGHLWRSRQSRVLAWTGVWLSVLALAAAFGFGALFLGARQWTQSMAAPTAEAFASWRGRPSPDLDLATLDGTRLRLAELKGRRVVLDFWATWCGPCVRGIPDFARLQRESGTNRLVIIGVSAEDRTVLKAFAGSRDIPYPLVSVANTDLPDPYARVRAFPTTFFLDAEGRVESVVIGVQPYETLKRLALGTGEPSSPASTPVEP